MSNAEKILQQMKSNPKDDWTPNKIKIICKAFNITLRQRGTSHAVLTNMRGEHLTVPMHKPIKPLYIRRLVELIEADQ
jgi:predicted RNA binding protein YcfA (HicA-like mRNA interferase family)